MTTLISQQPGKPPADYTAHVNRVLSRRRMVRPWLTLALAVVASLAAVWFTL
jgi:hypothetical protein